MTLSPTRTAGWIALATAATTTTAAPAARALMLRAGTLDIPNHRSSHTQPIPRGGGIACVVGCAAGAATLRHLAPVTTHRAPASLTLVPVAMAALGYGDDHTGGLTPQLRLAAQAVAGGVLAATCTTHPAGRVVLLASVPVFVNAVNFMDGINGITASTAIVWGLNAISVAGDDVVTAAVGAISAGAAVGFLPWNAPYAALFLGDAGSYLFGSIFASGLARALSRPSGAAAARTGVLVCAPLVPYVLDVTQAIVRRARAGDRLTEAHREHVYQRLVDHDGLGHVTVSTMVAAAAAASAAACRLPSRWAAATVVGVASTYLCLPSAARSLRRSGFVRHLRGHAR